jgi:hypothetical protein
MFCIKIADGQLQSLGNFSAPDFFALNQDRQTLHPAAPRGET